MTDRTVGRRVFIAGVATTAITACTSSRPMRTAQASTTTSPVAQSSSTSAPTFTSSGPTTRPLVALTFHVSGGRALTVALLDLLRSRRVVMTAFMVGAFVDANQDLLARLVRDGHELANHTY